MGEGDLKELRELVEFLKASGVAEFDMERPELKVRLKFAGVAQGAGGGGNAGADLAALARAIQVGGGSATAAPVSTPPAEPVASAPESVNAEPVTLPADDEAGLHIVKSPLVGMFYDAAAPGADPFVKIGDTVAAGGVLCIVEAMKIMNEIESDASGHIVKIFAKPGQPVEFGQRLFGIRL